MIMNKEKFKKEYFDWLVERVDGRGYEKLLLYLYKRPYAWGLERDKNRVEDAYQMRENYLNPGPYTLDVEPWVRELGDVSVLELFVSFAEQIDQRVMWDEDEGDRTSDWFWMMLHNIGLDGMDDEQFDQKRVTLFVDKFLSDGVLFPCRGARGLDLWMQMNRYFEENGVK